MTADTDVPPIVAMTGITIRFPGVLALDNVDFFLRPGEVHSLMGENGAGKSTLIKALTGVYSIDGGSILVDGVPRTFTTTADAQAAGISTVYQEVNLCQNLSVGENVMLGHEVRRIRRIDWTATHAEAARHLGNLGLNIDTRSTLSSHSIAIQQLVAISRAMVVDSRVLVLDEPTSSLDRSEVEQLFGVMRDLRDRGVAILFVSHFLDQVFEISDRITVLRNGKLVGESLASDLTRGSLVAKMLGRELAELESLSKAASDRQIDRTIAPVLQATDLGTPRHARTSSTSRSSTARSSASPASSAPVAPNSLACSTAPTTPTADASRYAARRPGSQPRVTRSTTASCSRRKTAAPKASSAI